MRVVKLRVYVRALRPHVRLWGQSLSTLKNWSLLHVSTSPPFIRSQAVDLWSQKLLRHLPLGSKLNPYWSANTADAMRI